MTGKDRKGRGKEIVRRRMKMNRRRGVMRRKRRRGRTRNAHKEQRATRGDLRMRAV